MKIRYDIWQYFKQRLEKINSISRITDFKEIEAVKTNDQCCVNCIGHGKECEEGGAWIYCDIRADHDEKFEGDYGESRGCQMFSSKKALSRMLDNLQRNIDAPTKSKETHDLEVDLEFDLSEFPFKELFDDEGKVYTGVNISKRQQEQLFEIMKDLYRLYYGEDFINSYKMNIKELLRKGMKYSDWLNPDKVNNQIEETKRIIDLNTEMNNFRELFKKGTVFNNPYKYRLKQMLNKDIDECDKFDLVCLGFNSNLFHANDGDEKKHT